MGLAIGDILSFSSLGPGPWRAKNKLLFLRVRISCPCESYASYFLFPWQERIKFLTNYVSLFHQLFRFSWLNCPYDLKIHQNLWHAYACNRKWRQLLGAVAQQPQGTATQLSFFVVYWIRIGEHKHSVNNFYTSSGSLFLAISSRKVLLWLPAGTYRCKWSDLGTCTFYKRQKEFISKFPKP